MFLERGYVIATMDDISRRAGMSKKTIYQLFPTKQALFAALIARNMAHVISPIRADDGSRAPRAVLRDFLRHLAHFALAPRQIAMQRLIISEVLRAPELAQSFQREAMEQGHGVLIDWLERQRRAGTLALDHAEEAASMLCGYVVSDWKLRLLYGLDAAPTDQAIDQRVDRALDIFLKGEGLAAPKAIP